MTRAPLSLFAGYGIELEYMIVDGEGLAVRPMADELLKAVGGGYDMEVDMGAVAWSNELALHVIELKTHGPSATLSGLAARFQEHVAHVNALLSPMGARLLPTAMHPWMDPDSELRLWPHEDDDIYRTFDRVFNCRGHGWANLQSTHINLPFANDEEFGRLHAATRLVLPLIPGLAASSPYMDGRCSPYLDTRVHVYQHNARRVPEVVGAVIPERVFSRADYEAELLQPIYRALSPLDPDGVLQHEWVNGRGCIARFDRMAIEIRLLDIQECPAADIAIAAALVAVVRALAESRLCSQAQQRRWHERELLALLVDSVRDGERTVIEDERFLQVFAYPEHAPAQMSDLWRHLVESLLAQDPSFPEWQPALELILGQGCLARRIVRVVGTHPSQVQLRDTYRELADCLAEGRLFSG